MLVINHLTYYVYLTLECPPAGGRFQVSPSNQKSSIENHQSEIVSCHYIYSIVVTTIPFTLYLFFHIPDAGMSF